MSTSTRIPSTTSAEDAPRPRRFKAQPGGFNRRSRLALELMRNEGDPWGAYSVPGAAQHISQRQLRKFRSEGHWYYKTRNGIWDPLTCMHIVDALMNVVPGVSFTSNTLVALLERRVESFAWDAVTVGRILNELADGLTDVLDEGDLPFWVSGRKVNGRHYTVTETSAGWRVLHALRNELAMEARNYVESGKVRPHTSMSILSTVAALQPGGADDLEARNDASEQESTDDGLVN